MGRRKIEIKTIPDDRNRSVTFLKRKGGLFKKAHELSVLCAVDVAVIIFGQNRKLYEYSSGDVQEIVGRFQMYGGAHEHKGPQDFPNKAGGGDEDEDEEGAEESEDRGGTPVPDQSMMRMQHHPGFQHVRHGTPSGSPPTHNGAMPQFQRGPSPMGTTISRPSSQASQHPGHLRRTSSNLVPASHAQHAQQASQNVSHAYAPNAGFYNQPQMQRPPPQGPHSQGQATYPPAYPQQAQPHPHIQHVMMKQDNRRQSMPPQYPPQQPPLANMQQHNPSHDRLQPPQHHPQSQQQHPSPRLPQQQISQRPMGSPQPPQRPENTSPPLPQPKPLPAHAKSHSIFTPIDDSRSMLAQHWGGTSNAEPARSEAAVKAESEGPRSQSIDVAAMQRGKGANQRSNGKPPRLPLARQLPQSPPLPQPQRTASNPVVQNTRAPARPNPQTSDPAKRPRLKVQIPSENSGDEAGTPSAQDGNSTPQPANNAAGGSQHLHQQSQHPGPSLGVVLPPPSPSAGALLSAGAQGPPNPFARPAPPMSTNPHAVNRDAAGTAPNPNIETPISALPSRFMSDNLLPSPSTFYPEWGFGRQGDSNTLPSPLNFQTPVTQGMGMGWQRGGAGEEESRKRGMEEEDRGGGDAKKSRT